MYIEHTLENIAQHDSTVHDKSALLAIRFGKISVKVFAPSAKLTLTLIELAYAKYIVERRTLLSQERRAQIPR